MYHSIIITLEDNRISRGSNNNPHAITSADIFNDISTRDSRTHVINDVTSDVCVRVCERAACGHCFHSLRAVMLLSALSSTTSLSPPQCCVYVCVCECANTTQHNTAEHYYGEPLLYQDKLHAHTHTHTARYYDINHTRSLIANSHTTHTQSRSSEAKCWRLLSHTIYNTSSTRAVLYR